MSIILQYIEYIVWLHHLHLCKQPFWQRKGMKKIIKQQFIYWVIKYFMEYNNIYHRCKQILFCWVNSNESVYAVVLRCSITYTLCQSENNITTNQERNALTCGSNVVIKCSHIYIETIKCYAKGLIKII